MPFKNFLFDYFSENWVSSVQIYVKKIYLLHSTFSVDYKYQTS
jgi:hypothetical protein